MHKKETWLLVIEPEQNLRQLLIYSLESAYSVQVLAAKDVTQGLDFWQTYQNDIKAIISDHRIDQLNSAIFVQEIKKSKKNIPLIITSSERPEKFESLQKHSLLGVEKENIILNLMDKLDVFLSDFKNNQSQYAKISLDSLQNFAEMGEDIFYRLNSQRFIKMFHYNSQPSTTDIERYRSKGLDYFYILKNRNQVILNVLDQEMPIIIENNISLSQINIAKKTANQFQLAIDSPLELENYQQIRIKKIIEEQIKNLNKVPILKEYLELLMGRSISIQIAQQHLGQIINIAISVASNLDWESEDILSNLTYSLICYELLMVQSGTQNKSFKNIYQWVLFLETQQLNKESNFNIELQELITILSEDPERPMEVDRILQQLSEMLSGQYLNQASYQIKPMSLIALLAIDLSAAMIQSTHLEIEFQLSDYLEEFAKRFPFKGVEQIVSSFSVYWE